MSLLYPRIFFLLLLLLLLLLFFHVVEHLDVIPAFRKHVSHYSILMNTVFLVYISVDNHVLLMFHIIIYFSPQNNIILYYIFHRRGVQFYYIIFFFRYIKNNYPAGLEYYYRG